MKDKNKKHGKGTVPRRVMSAIRQMAYPTEVRIGVPDTIEREDEEVSEQDGASPAMPIREMNLRPVDRSDAMDAELLKLLHFLIEMGTTLWRLRQKMVHAGTDQPLDEMRRAYRHFEAAWDLLAQTGVEIQDHTDLPYDTGMDLNVLTFQPMPDFKCEIVVETMRPTIYYKGRMVQRGEVIVGTPENAALGKQLNDGLTDL
jgi:hypothetical protein